MKQTALEVLFKTTNGDADYISVNNCLEAMKLYANAKLDEAAEVACDSLELYPSEYTKLEKSILSLKDHL